MSDQFKHYWPLSEEERQEVWDTGRIILDTNVLLAPYRMSEAARDNLLSLLEHDNVRSRLWIPHRVAEECFKNRTVVVSGQRREAAKFVKSVDRFLGELRDEGNELRKDHPLIKKDHWFDKIQETIDNLKKAYEDAQEEYDFAYHADKVIGRIIALLTDRIGPATVDTKVAELKKDYPNRVKEKRPPGFKDNDKDIDRAIGDPLIWEQILEEMSDAKEHAIFVLDDRKEDWWLIEGGELLGALPELRREYRSRTGKEIQFVQSPRFMDWAKELTHMKVVDTFDSELRDALRRPNQSTMIFQRHFDDIRKFRERMKWLENNPVAKEALRIQRERERWDQLIRPNIRDIIDPPSSGRLDANTIRNIIAHGAAPSFTAEDIARWFLENYEDADANVPRDPDDGSFLFEDGDPRDVSIEINNRYAGVADEDTIMSAIETVESAGGAGVQWVRKGLY